MGTHRRTLIDTFIKRKASGYLPRLLIKPGKQRAVAGLRKG